MMTLMHESVEIGQHTKIGHGVVIDENVKIGTNCFIGHNTVIRSGVTLSDGVVIGHLCVIESDTMVGPYTTIQSQCHITKGARIGQQVYFGPCVTVINEQKISKWRPNMEQKLVGPQIGDYARIGARALIMPGLLIGNHAEIGAGCVLTKDVGNYERWMGPQAAKVGLVPLAEASLRKGGDNG